MRYIQKTGTIKEKAGRKETKRLVDECWCINDRQYKNLYYDRGRMGALCKVLISEQSDTKGSYCCYCMRKLFLNDNAGHKRNVTIEHIIPHNIKRDAWNRDRVSYAQFPNLQDKYITICFDGALTEAQKSKRFTRIPYPHFISYHNLVASCDGSMFESNKIISGRCCNNKRQDKFVMPVYLSSEMAGGISYDSKGKLDFDDEYYGPMFSGDCLNLTCAWLTLVRRLWYRLSNSDYTDQDVEHAIEDKNLRQDIIDDIDFSNQISSWHENDSVWILFSEYSWFYHYYSNK